MKVAKGVALTARASLKRRKENLNGSSTMTATTNSFVMSDINGYASHFNFSNEAQPKQGLVTQKLA